MHINLTLILHNIRSAHNVGSIFRTADAAGVSKIYLTGYSPLPVDRYGRPRNDIRKTALGAEKTVPWEHTASISTLVKQLRTEGTSCIALERDPRALHYLKFKPKKKVALILGNEVRGISPAILKQCDAIIEIPMSGKKESLNVSVAAGIAVYGIMCNRI